MKLSIAIATYNEESYIKRCLDAIKDFADEIIVVDGQSTDNTTKIIRQYSQAKIISTTNKPLFHINKQIAIEACKSDWIFQLDADEVVTPELKKEILAVIDQPTADGYWINRRNFFLGRFLTKGGVYPDPTIRLYKNGHGKLPCLDVHEQAEVKGTVGNLKSDLLHYADPTFSRYLLRNDRYTSLIASDLKKQKITFNFFSFVNFFIFKPIHWFFLTFFRHRGYVDGFPGFVFSWYSSLRFPLAYIKLYEMSQKNEKI
jgi:glycosyltransferase involved in cell wall biosynthesis